jgi:hypothetical protein
LYKIEIGMRRRPVSNTATFLAAALGAGTLVAGLTGVEPPARAAQTRPAVGAPATRITTLVENGGRLDWSERHDLIVFDRLDGDAFNVYTMRPNASDVRCLTCDSRTGMPARHQGNPAWHPAGELIVFQAQNDYKGLGRITDYFANPGAGVNNDLWVMDRGGRQFWRLTNTRPRTGGVLHPQFSRDGNRLFWAERVDARGIAGTWSLRVADFMIGSDRPSIQQEQVLQPGDQHEFYESHGFSPDGRLLLFSGNLQRGQPMMYGDIYLYDMRSRELTNLTQSPNEWDEHAHFSPDGRTIVWMSSKDIPGRVRAERLRTDYWMMSPDGSNKRRLTHFNTPGHPESVEQGLTAADFAWSPDGGRMAAYLITDVRKGGRIVMIDMR